MSSGDGPAEGGVIKWWWAAEGGVIKWWYKVVGSVSNKINEYEMNIHTYGLKQYVLDMSLRPVYPTEGGIIKW